MSKFPDAKITISIAKDHGIAFPRDTCNITHAALQEQKNRLQQMSKNCQGVNSGHLGQQPTHIRWNFATVFHRGSFDNIVKQHSVCVREDEMFL